MTEYREGSEVAGRFVISQRIGEGGMGEVYRAQQTSLGRDVALKVLHAQNAFTARARRRFAREARAIARLNHPHIAGVYDFGVDEANQALWLAMELIDGDGMMVLKQESIDLVRILSLTDQILSALSAAHARGIIHRDLKPSNILLTRNNDQLEVIKLVDFGLAAMQGGDFDLSQVPGLSQEDSEVNERVILGTPRYMAPEIFKRVPADPKVDLYALGVILYEIMAGVPPFPGDDPRKVMKAHLHAPIPQLLPREGVELPTDFERLVYKLLAKDSRERYQTAAEVREDIGTIINEFSYVPWMTMGPRNNDAATFNLAGNISMLGVISQFGGQTVPPSALLGGQSKFGSIGSQNGPLVGRAKERRSIEQHIKAALREARGSLILLEGEAGVGKSRLADWIKVRVAESGVMRVAQGSYSRATHRFSGFREVLEQLLGTDDYPNESVPFVIKQILAPWGFTEDEIALCVRLVRPLDDAQNMEPEQDTERTIADKERVFSTIERVLRQLATERPLLIILEDLHDAGDTTIGFLEHIAVGLHLSPAPVVFLSTLRRGELDRHTRLKAALDRLVRFSSEDIVRLQLKRLTLEEAHALVLKLTPLDEELAWKLAERAEGNPLHLKQILQFLQESGKLKYDSGKWRLVEGVQLTREIPDEVADMMRYRASQVCLHYGDSEAMRAIIERCAVIGQRFEYKLLLHMLSLEAGQPWLKSLDAILEELIQQGILREVGLSGEDMLEFDHGIMRDVLIKDMGSKRSHRAMHKAVAEAKIDIWGQRANARALEIAAHYRMAKDLYGVYRFTLKAAQSALSACDLKSAMHYFKQAEEISTMLDDAQRAVVSRPSTKTILHGDQVALLVSHLERRLGEYEQAKQSYKKLLGSDEAAVSLWARWGLGELAERHGDYDEAVVWFEEARRESMRAFQFSQEVPKLEAMRVDAYCLYGLGCITLARGDLRSAVLALGEALEQSEQTQDQELESNVLWSLSHTHWALGLYQKAKEYRRSTLMISEHSGDRELLAHAFLHSAQHLEVVGQPGEASKRALTAKEYFEEIGKRHHVAHCLLVLGHIAWGRGQHKEAAQTFRQAHRFYEMFRDRRGLADCKHHLAQLALSLDRFQDTQTLVCDALEGYRAMGDRRGEARCWLIVGRLELSLNHYKKAVRTFEDAQRVFDDIGDVHAGLIAHTLRLASLMKYEVVHDDDLCALLKDLERLSCTREPLAFALDMLSEQLSEVKPDLALEFDTHAEKIWQQLGRPIRHLS